MTSNWFQTIFNRQKTVLFSQFKIILISKEFFTKQSCLPEKKCLNLKQRIMMSCQHRLRKRPSHHFEGKCILFQTKTTGKHTIKSLSLIHISEPTRRTPISYAVFCLKKKKNPITSDET